MRMRRKGYIIADQRDMDHFSGNQALLAYGPRPEKAAPSSSAS